MKVDQKNKTNPNMWSKCLTITPIYLNMEHSPPVQYADNCLRPGKYPRYFPASSATCSLALGHHQHCILPCHALCCIWLLLFIVSSPSYLPLDPETDAAPEDCYSVDDPSFAAELPGKQPSLTHAYITYSFSLLLALEIATALFYPILMHSLFL